MQVIILVCALALSAADCTRETARLILQAPEADNEAMCGFNGQAYLAQTALLQPGEYVKIQCRQTAIGRSTVG